MLQTCSNYHTIPIVFGRYIPHFQSEVGLRQCNGTLLPRGIPGFVLKGQIMVSVSGDRSRKNWWLMKRVPEVAGFPCW